MMIDGLQFDDEPRISIIAYHAEIPRSHIVRYKSIPVIEYWDYKNGQWHIHDQVIS